MVENVADGHLKIFECRLCGVCCLGRGGVRFDEAGAAEAALYLGLEEPEFRRLYLRPGPEPWDIRLDPEGYCLFHQPGGLCLIHAVKPEICRRWPFLPALLNHESAFLDARAACPGLRADLTWAEFKAAGP